MIISGAFLSWRRALTGRERSEDDSLVNSQLPHQAHSSTPLCVWSPVHFPGSSTRARMFTSTDCHMNTRERHSCGIVCADDKIEA